MFFVSVSLIFVKYQGLCWKYTFISFQKMSTGYPVTKLYLFSAKACRRARRFNFLAKFGTVLKRVKKENKSLQHFKTSVLQKRKNLGSFHSDHHTGTLTFLFPACLLIAIAWRLKQVQESCDIGFVRVVIASNVTLCKRNKEFFGENAHKPCPMVVGLAPVVAWEWVRVVIIQVNATSRLLDPTNTTHGRDALFGLSTLQPVLTACSVRRKLT